MDLIQKILIMPNVGMLNFSSKQVYFSLVRRNIAHSLSRYKGKKKAAMSDFCRLLVPPPVAGGEPFLIYVEAWKYSSSGAIC